MRWDSEHDRYAYTIEPKIVSCVSINFLGVEDGVSYIVSAA
jgi:hypothetical protein